MKKPEPSQSRYQPGDATDPPPEAEVLIQLALEVQAKTDKCEQSRQRAAELRRRAEFLTKQMQAATARAKRLRENARKIMGRKQGAGREEKEQL